MRVISPSKLPTKAGVSLLFVALLLWLLPIKDAFQPGGDEGCELLKSFLFSSDCSLYRGLWNDQPPLHTMILSTVFRVVGPSLPAGRVLAIGFGGLLLYSLMSAVWLRCGRCAALAAGAILASSPMFLNLSFSVMLEVPAFATAMLAVWLLFRWLEERRPVWLVLSGVVMGCALQIKFTAALVLPAMAVEAWRLRSQKSEVGSQRPEGRAQRAEDGGQKAEGRGQGLEIRSPKGEVRSPDLAKAELKHAQENHGTPSAAEPQLKTREDDRGIHGIRGKETASMSISAYSAVHNLKLLCARFTKEQAKCEARSLLDAAKALLVWVGALAFTFAAIAVVSGESLGTMWISHTHVVSAAGIETTGPSGLGFKLSDLADHLETLAPAVLGLLAIAWRRTWRQMAFPLVFLGTCLVVHLLHRPYWYYYYLHFVMAMAWIGGYGFAESVSALRSVIATGIGKARPMVLWFGWLGICAGVIVVLEGWPKVRWELESLAGLPRVGNDGLVRKLRENASATRWMYSDEYVYPFLAHLRVPPELVVMPRKRFWSGELDGEGVLRCVRRYQPEQVLLSGGSKMSPEWERTDGTNYFVAYEDGAYRLFVAKGLLPRNTRNTRN